MYKHIIFCMYNKCSDETSILSLVVLQNINYHAQEYQLIY